MVPPVTKTTAVTPPALPQTTTTTTTLTDNDDIELLTMNWIQTHTRQCPNCGYYIERSDDLTNDGSTCCHLMECLCGFLFCYQCGHKRYSYRDFRCRCSSTCDPTQRFCYNNVRRKRLSQEELRWNSNSIVIWNKKYDAKAFLMMAKSKEQIPRNRRKERLINPNQTAEAIFREMYRKEMIQQQQEKGEDEGKEEEEEETDEEEEFLIPSFHKIIKVRKWLDHAHVFQKHNSRIFQQRHHSKMCQNEDDDWILRSNGQYVRSMIYGSWMFQQSNNNKNGYQRLVKQYHNVQKMSYRDRERLHNCRTKQRQQKYEEYAQLFVPSKDNNTVIIGRPTDTTTTANTTSTKTTTVVESCIMKRCNDKDSTTTTTTTFETNPPDIILTLHRYMNNWIYISPQYRQDYMFRQLSNVFRMNATVQNYNNNVMHGPTAIIFQINPKKSKWNTL